MPADPIYTGTMPIHAVRAALVKAEREAKEKALSWACRRLGSAGDQEAPSYQFDECISDARRAIDEAARAHANHLALTEEAKK